MSGTCEEQAYDECPVVDASAKRDEDGDEGPDSHTQAEHDLAAESERQPSARQLHSVCIHTYTSSQSQKGKHPHLQKYVSVEVSRQNQTLDGFVPHKRPVLGIEVMVLSPIQTRHRERPLTKLCLLSWLWA